MTESFTVEFLHQGAAQQIAGGSIFAAPREIGFRDTPKSDLQAIIRRIKLGENWRMVVDEKYAAPQEWLHRIITSPTRTAFFDSVLTDGDGVALDLGAGWGQICRPLARRRPVVAVEPVAERLAFIKAAAQQDGVQNRIAYLEADYLELEFTTKFSCICAIGVLEWAGAFQETSNPQQRQRAFLAKARRDLAPGGELVLGIENRIGLKYLLGCPDDHIGVANIASLPSPIAERRWRATSGHTLRSFTYSMRELDEMLAAAGFSQRTFYGAYPDYKLPQKIVSFADRGADANRWLSENSPPDEHNGYDGSPLEPSFQESLAAHYRTLAQEGIAHHFAPSFFVRAQ